MWRGCGWSCVHLRVPFARLYFLLLMIKDYKIKKLDIIKLGRVRFKIKDI